MIRLWNNVKTAVLLAGLMGLCMLVGSRFGPQGLLIGLVLGLVMNLGAWFFSDKIAIAAMGGQEVDERTGGELYRLVDELRQRAGLPMPRVFICPQEAPNAFATGRSPSHAAVCFTRGLLEVMNKPELEGVIAHELTHVRNRDTLTSAIAATIAGVVSYLAQMLMWTGGGGDRRDGHPILSLAAIILAPIGAALIQLAISRSREFVADAGAKEICGSPDGLVSALKKLHGYSQRIPMDNPNPAANSLFIVEPFTGGAIAGLFATHPPVEERIAALLS